MRGSFGARGHRLLPTLLAFAVLATAAAASASTGGRLSDRQTKRRAEVTLLISPRRLARFAPALIDRRTGLLWTNTQAQCRGLDRAVRGRYHVLRCVVSHGATRLVLRYTAVGRRGAQLERLAS